MESISKKLLRKSQEAGGEEPERLQLGTKIDGGGVKSTGKHIVKLISQKAVKGQDFHTNEERAEIEYVFEEDGIEKFYRVPVKNKVNKLHYLIRAMAGVINGEEISLEMKSSGGKNFVELNHMGGVEEDLDEPADEEEEESKAEQEEGVELDISKIPF